uniref:E2F/DP family winged-helix DNA-binding domain-containing protein n=1 Tax=Romanomermis culicivorax TaxID=13658 RepID=A0A915KS91_ROMCU
MFTATKLSATPSANSRGINFMDVPIMTVEELQAAQAIQDLKAASLANSTPKSTKSKDFSIKYDANLNDSISPIILAADLIPMSPNSATAETPRAKRKLHMPCHVSENVTILTKESDCAFKTPQSNGSRRRKASEMSKQSSVSEDSPKSSRPKFTCLSPSMTRYDTSLCVLTQRFIDHMNSSIDGKLSKLDWFRTTASNSPSNCQKNRSRIINLNEAAIMLQVPKRRIYDITNVLEGIDLIEKCGKNSCRFRNLDFEEYGTPEERSSKREISALHRAEQTLDSLLNIVQRELNGNIQDKRGKAGNFQLDRESRSNHEKP